MFRIVRSSGGVWGCDSNCASPFREKRQDVARRQFDLTDGNARPRHWNEQIRRCWKTEELKDRGQTKSGPLISDAVERKAREFKSSSRLAPKTAGGLLSPSCRTRCKAPRIWRSGYFDGSGLLALACMRKVFGTGSAMPSTKVAQANKLMRRRAQEHGGFSGGGRTGLIGSLPTIADHLFPTFNVPRSRVRAYP
ncbi:hypothetical protein DFH09DRAFT_1081656 [Mycena vulgaris]|nr:hypothetical protein DFH09DRAFT_1081656 [Mycena vulgaris]